MAHYLMAVDQGTTSTRAIIFDRGGKILVQAQQAFTQHFPQDGWVEHDPQEIYQSVLQVCREALAEAQLSARDIAAMGISNQRETTVVWDKDSGQAIYNAIVWQDRRSADYCRELKAQGREQAVNDKTGLLLDPYFSATKLRWILDNVAGAREQAEAGQLLFGTIDSFLLWKLTGQHKTDITNAARTLLCNIHDQQWDPSLLALFDIPRRMLPSIEANSHEFGVTHTDILGGPIMIGGMAGDQQAALIGQACFSEGMAKSTYGTGCFMMLNTGPKPRKSQHRLLTTVAYSVGGITHYALEGSIFMAGATLQWLRDGPQLIKDASDSVALAQAVGADNSVYLVPAFTGLGAPYWDPDARAAILGLTRDSGRAEMVTAGLQSVCYQSRDLLQAMARDKLLLSGLRVDGGMVVNDWLMQFLADILNLPIQRAAITETSALGAAYLAGLTAGIYTDLQQLSGLWQSPQTFVPQMSAEQRERLYLGWQDSVARVRSGD